MKSILLKTQKEVSKVKWPVLKYNEEERKQITRIYECMTDSWAQMNIPLDEFDGKSLIQQCEVNRKARNSFLTPIMNDGEVRVVTGTTEGKMDSVFNSVFNQYLESEVRAFNEFDVEDYELGRSLSNIVKRTKQIERDEVFNEAALREILSMPAVYVQEIMDDRMYYDRKLSSGNWEDLWNFKIPKFKKDMWLRKREPRKVLWTCDQVFLANIRIPKRLFHLQPHVITYKIRSYEDAQTIYGQSPRWKHVKPGAIDRREFESQIETSEWRFASQMKNSEVEEIIYKSVSGDEMQVILNGVNLLPVGCPYIGIGNKYKCYDMTMEGMKEINPKFAYCRSLVSMATTLQALKDESFRLMILKYRQKIWEPVVTKAKAILSKDMWLPAAITYGIAKDEIESLMSDRGVDSGDKAMQDMIESEIEKFINVPEILQGISEGKMTAHEVAQRMKQALINLGSALTAYIRLVQNCDYLRLYNILCNKTESLGLRYNELTGESEKYYTNYSIDEVELFDGKMGTEVIQFIDRKLLEGENQSVLKLEKESRDRGKPKSFTFLDIQKLRMVPYMFYISVVPTEKQSSLLEREIFKKDIADAIEIGMAVGIPVNGEYATQEFAKRTKLDARRLYNVPQPMMPMAPEETSAKSAGPKLLGSPTQPTSVVPNKTA